MKIETITGAATRLNLLGLFNCYLVREEDDTLTLIDTTMAIAAKDILHHVRAMNAPIRRIVLTHAHVDHLAGIDALAAQLPDVEVWMSARETRMYHEAQRGLKPKQFALEPGEPQTPIRGSFPKTKTAVTHQFNDGDQIGSLQALFTPGHTPGHMAFMDRRDATLFAGDALVSVGALRVSGDAHWSFPLPNMATWHPPTALASGLRISMAQPEGIVFGHGSPVFGTVQQISEKLAAALDHAGKKFAHR